MELNLILERGSFGWEATLQPLPFDEDTQLHYAGELPVVLEAVVRDITELAKSRLAAQ